MRQCALGYRRDLGARWLAAAGLLLLATLFAATARAAPEPWVVSGQEVGPALLHAEVFFDRTLALDFAAVQSPAMAARFVPNFRPIYNKQPVPGALWVRFAIKNPEPTPLARVLVVDNRSIDELDVWLDKPGGSWSHYSSGQHVAVAERVIQTTTPMFPITVPAGGDSPRRDAFQRGDHDRHGGALDSS